MKKVKISNNVIRRLPRYLRKLDELSASGVVRVSSSDLGRQLGITPSQVRQDLSTFGEFGLQGYGYNVVELREIIAGILGSDCGFNAVLVGAGKIGRALLSGFRFEDCGVTMQCAFDVNRELIGMELDGVPVLPMEGMSEYLQNHSIDIAVLAVPKVSAAAITRELAQCGVDAIWNFTNAELPRQNSDLIIENIHFSDSLYALSYYLSEKRQGENWCYERQVYQSVAV